MSSEEEEYIYDDEPQYMTTYAQSQHTAAISATAMLDESTPIGRFMIKVKSVLNDLRRDKKISDDDVKSYESKLYDLAKNIIDDISYRNAYAFTLGFICVNNTKAKLTEMEKIAKKYTYKIEIEDIFRYTRLFKRLISM